MAYLFKTFQEIKTQLGGAVNQSMDLNSIAPIIDDTYTTHFERYIPRSFSNVVNDQYQANTLTTANTALLPYYQKALAMLSMYEYLQVLPVQISDAGVRRVESDTAKSAYKYQERQARDYYLQKGYAALESMLRFLDAGDAAYNTWRTSEEAITHLRQVVPYASQLKQLASWDIDRHTYQYLAPALVDMQRQCFEAHVPALFVSGFLDRCQAGTLTTAEKKLRSALTRHLGAAAIHDAQVRQILSIDGGRVTVREEYGDSNASNRTAPPVSAAGYSERAWAFREAALRQEWVRLIMATPSDYPTIFDTASGGTNTASDAWHIDTQDEREARAISQAKAMDQPIMLM